MIEQSWDETDKVMGCISDHALTAQESSGQRFFKVPVFRISLHVLGIGSLKAERMATLRKQYSVSRPLYSDDSFAEDHEKVQRQRKTILDHVKQYLT